MKHLILSIVISIVYLQASAQKREMIEQYCFVRLHSPTLSLDMFLEVDDGKRNIQSSFFNKRVAVSDSAGNPLRFKSSADALNHMGKKGWKLVEVMPPNSEISTTTYLFKREVELPVAKTD